jgi:hypothetical protein
MKLILVGILKDKGVTHEEQNSRILGQLRPEVIFDLK